MTPQTSISSPHVVVIGAGPSGCLLALLLAQDAGARVTLFDARPDMRGTAHDATNDQRSINLAISTRGLTALERVGLADEVRSRGVPMSSRCVHLASSGGHQLHPYGQPGQHLLSVSRTALAAMLQTACEKHPDVTLQFGHKCTAVNLEMPSVTVKDSVSNIEHVVRPSLVVGADGSFSKVRAAMAREPGFNFSQHYIPCMYKELSFTPPNENILDCCEKEAIYPSNSLHIWPRQDFMLIALPNWHDGVANGKDAANNGAVKPKHGEKTCEKESIVKTFTATLFMPPQQFEQLEGTKEGAEKGENSSSVEQRVETFFKEHFPDALSALPDLAKDFTRNPTAPLLTIRCEPYHYSGNCVLIGDAAHAIVPFYGQGCNAAMEDTTLLVDLIKQHGWEKASLHTALSEYSRRRKPNADAIADLAAEHYYDMSSRSASKYFVLKRRVEIMLNKLFPATFLPLYSLVSFSNVEYSKAVETAKKQDTLIGRGIGVTAGLVLLSATTAALMGATKYRLLSKFQ